MATLYIVTKQKGGWCGALQYKRVASSSLLQRSIRILSDRNPTQTDTFIHSSADSRRTPYLRIRGLETMLNHQSGHLRLAQPYLRFLCDMTCARTRLRQYEHLRHLHTCTARAPLKYDTNLSYTSCVSSRHLSSPPYSHPCAVTFLAPSPSPFSPPYPRFLRRHLPRTRPYSLRFLALPACY